jgi:hypothetical protein
VGVEENRGTDQADGKADLPDTASEKKFTQAHCLGVFKSSLSQPGIRTKAITQAPHFQYVNGKTRAKPVQ